MKDGDFHVAVIGAGVGGLTCAALLARAGVQVTVIEKNGRVGGKLGWLEQDGYNWDMGPSLVTMPHVFRQLWQKLGRHLEDDLTLIPLPNTCRYRWTDGTCIDENAAFWQRDDVSRFLSYAAGLYELSADTFLHHPLEEWWKQVTWRNLGKLRHFPKIATFQTMDQVVRRFFAHDPHLVQLFDRFATYNGSSPYRTPAAFNIIPFVEAKFGGWYIKGGLYEIARALERICLAAGVEIRTGAEVFSVRPEGQRWRLESRGFNGDRCEAFHYVVCNQDVLSARQSLLPYPSPESGLRERDLSISAFILYLGVARQFPQLDHHNIFFSNDYPAEFRQLFDQHRPVDEPTIYVAVHSRSDPDRAPPGCENWFVLVNAPALHPRNGVDWQTFAHTYGDRIIDRLETDFGLRGLRSAVQVRKHFTPWDFKSRYHAHEGALYGYASHGVRAAFQRPKMCPPGRSNFCYVGGSTHPGGGLPLVCLSGQMAARKVLRLLPPLR